MENNNIDKDYVTCKVCGFKSKRIYGNHLKSHGMTSEDYKKQYPGEPLYTESDIKNVTKFSGLHMKEEKYKKMFSEKIKGDKNPNHKSNTTIEQRKKCSPFSKDFVKYSNLTDDEKEETLKSFVKDVCDNKTYTTRLDYWINKGYSEDDANKKLKERQTTFTLNLCIEKYGEESGTEIYNNRQQKWQKSLLDNGNLKCGYSEVSQLLFYSIIDFYNLKDRVDIYFATKNKEYFICEGKGEFYQYDFVDLKNKKIIEYNGDKYHANPNIFESIDYPHPFRKNVTAQEIWDKDERKIQVAEENGFEVLVIWDSEYKSQKEKTLDKCKKYLNLCLKTL